MTKALSPEPAIHTAGLHKSFGRTHALDGLDLDVAAGEVHGFLGPNGAGKSTTIRVLLGLLRADRGTIRLLGLSARVGEVLKTTRLVGIFDIYDDRIEAIESFS